MTVYSNPKQEIPRVVGNREPICFQLQGMTGSNLNLTDRTLKFRMVQLPHGKVIVNNSAATLDDAANGKVSFTPSADHVANKGRFACYFVDDTETPNKIFPYDGARFIIRIKGEAEE